MMTDLPTVKRSADEVERDVLAYGAAVADALGDLPLEAQSELLDGLHDHLVEIAAEGDLVELIGPADRYAAELRGDAEPVRQAAEHTRVSSSDASEPVPESQTTSPRIELPWKVIAQLVALAIVAFFAVAWLFDLNGRARKADVVGPAIVAGGLLAAAWWIAQRVVRPQWRRTVGIVLVAAALLIAARLGVSAGFHRDQQNEVFPPGVSSATTVFAPVGTALPPPQSLPVPDVRGMRRVEAIGELSRRGLAVTIVEVPVARASGDIVIDQEPVHDSVVDAGSVVIIRIATSTGAEPTLSASTTFPPVSTQVASPTTFDVSSVTTVAP